MEAETETGGKLVKGKKKKKSDKDEGKVAIIGLRALVPTILMLLRSARKHDTELVVDIVNTMKDVVSELPPLSLTPAEGFTPEVQAAMQPIFDFFHTLSAESQDIKSDAKHPAIHIRDAGSEHSAEIAKKLMSARIGLALARGSVGELLSLANTFLKSTGGDAQHASGKELQACLQSLSEFSEKEEEEDTKKKDAKDAKDEKKAPAPGGGAGGLPGAAPLAAPNPFGGGANAFGAIPPPAGGAGGLDEFGNPLPGGGGAGLGNLNASALANPLAAETKEAKAQKEKEAKEKRDKEEKEKKEKEQAEKDRAEGKIAIPTALEVLKKFAPFLVPEDPKEKEKKENESKDGGAGGASATSGATGSSSDGGATGSGGSSDTAVVAPETLQPDVVAGVILSQLDRISGESAINTQSAASDKPRKAYFINSQGNRIHATGLGYDTERRLSGRSCPNPKTPLQPDEILDLKWVAPNRFCVRYAGAQIYWVGGGSNSNSVAQCEAVMAAAQATGGSQWDDTLKNYSLLKTPLTAAQLRQFNVPDPEAGWFSLRASNYYLYCSGTYVECGTPSVRADSIWRVVDASVPPGTSPNQMKGVIMSWPLVFDLHVNTFASIAEIIERCCNATFKEGEDDAYYLQMTILISSLRVVKVHLAQLNRLSAKLKLKVLPEDKVKKLWVQLYERVPNAIASPYFACSCSTARLPGTALC